MTSLALPPLDHAPGSFAVSADGARAALVAGETLLVVDIASGGVARRTIPRRAYWSFAPDLRTMAGARLIFPEGGDGPLEIFAVDDGALVASDLAARPHAIKHAPDGAVWALTVARTQVDGLRTTLAPDALWRCAVGAPAVRFTPAMAPRLWPFHDVLSFSADARTAAYVSGEDAVVVDVAAGLAPRATLRAPPLRRKAPARVHRVILSAAGDRAILVCGSGTNHDRNPVYAVVDVDAAVVVAGTRGVRSPKRERATLLHAGFDGDRALVVYGDAGCLWSWPLDANAPTELARVPSDANAAVVVENGRAFTLISAWDAGAQVWRPTLAVR